jgi:hypothetical protein
VGGVPTYEEKTIAELISKIPYEKTWVEIYWGGGSRTNIFEALFIIILGVSYESVGKLTLDADSAEWRKWDSELKFLSVEPFAGAGTSVVSLGGGRRRKTRRTRKRRN